MFTEVHDTVQSGTHGDATRVVVCGSKCTEHLSFHVFNLAGFGIVHLFRIAEEPVHAIRYARRDIDIFEEREVWKTDLEVVVHTVLELVPESWLVELGCLEADSVLKRGVVTEGELLIPFLLTDSDFLFERVET